MKLNVMLEIALLAALWACGDDRAPQASPDDPGRAAANSKSSGDATFPLEVLGAISDARVRLDVPAKRAAEEIDYTKQWLAVALQPAALKPIDAARFHFVSGLGPKGDDAVVGAWDIEGGRVEVIDGREMIFVVPEQEGDESVQDLWCRLFRRGRETVSSEAEVILQTLGSLSGSGAWGTVRLASPPASWFASPPHWYRLPDRIVFSFEKRRLGPRGPRIPVGDAPRYIGGIPSSDTRQYLRFEPTNRIPLAQAWAREINGPDEPHEGPGYGLPPSPSTPSDESQR